MTNPIRVCIGCAQSDDHPRHVIATIDGGSVPWHMDCHKLATGCEVCTAQLADAKNKTGDALRKFLLGTGPLPELPGWTALPDTEFLKEVL